MPAKSQYSGITSREVIGRFYQTLESNMDRGWPSLLGMEMPSDQESETYNWLGMAPALREWVGGRNPKGLRENGLTIANKKFEATMQVPLDDLNRDKTGQLQLRIDELSDRVIQHWASLLSTFILNGNGDTNGLAYDGQYFFDTDHSEGDSGTLSNLLTASDYGNLNVNTPAAPTADEFAKALVNIISHFFTFKDDQGEPLNEGAMKFAILTPIGLWGPAYEAVNSKFLATGSGVRDNTTIPNQFDIQVIPNPRLTWTTDFAVFRTDGRTKPFILQEEEGVRMTAKAEGSDFEHDNDAHEYGVKAKRNVGYGQWQHAIRATFS